MFGLKSLPRRFTKMQQIIVGTYENTSSSSYQFVNGDFAINYDDDTARLEIMHSKHSILEVHFGSIVVTDVRCVSQKYGIRKGRIWYSIWCFSGCVFEV